MPERSIEKMFKAEYFFIQFCHFSSNTAAAVTVLVCFVFV